MKKLLLLSLVVFSVVARADVAEDQPMENGATSPDAEATTIDGAALNGEVSPAPDGAAPGAESQNGQPAETQDGGQPQQEER